MQKGQVLFGVICTIGAIVFLIEKAQEFIGVNLPTTNPTIKSGIGALLGIFGISLIALGLKD